MEEDVAVVICRGECPLGDRPRNGTVLAAEAAEVENGQALIQFLDEPNDAKLYVGKEMHGGQFAWKPLKASLQHIPRVDNQVIVFVQASGSNRDMDIYIRRLDHHFKAVSKGLCLALKPTFRKLRRAPSVARSDESLRDADFKRNLVQIFYNINSPTPVLECPITKLRLPSFEVRAGHIFPVRAEDDLSELCPDIPNINHTRNGILWAEPIEQAFETSCIYFTWSAENHTLTPRVLDVNLLGKTMLEANQYMKGNKEKLVIAETEMSVYEMEHRLTTEMKKIAEENTANKQNEGLRNKVQANLQPYVNQFYLKVSFDDINGKAIKLPESVELSQGAFELAAAFALDEAKKRGVLPDGFESDPRRESEGDAGLLDLFFASQELSDEYMDDSSADSESSSEQTYEHDLSVGPAAIYT